jgi:hypothetical protein
MALSKVIRAAAARFGLIELATLFRRHISCRDSAQFFGYRVLEDIRTISETARFTLSPEERQMSGDVARGPRKGPANDEQREQGQGGEKLALLRGRWKSIEALRRALL